MIFLKKLFAGGLRRGRDEEKETRIRANLARFAVASPSDSQVLRPCSSLRDLAPLLPSGVARSANRICYSSLAFPPGAGRVALLSHGGAVLHSPLRGSLSQALRRSQAAACSPRRPSASLKWWTARSRAANADEGDLRSDISVFEYGVSHSPAAPDWRRPAFAGALAITTHEVGSEARLRRAIATPPVRSDGKASDEQQMRFAERARFAWIRVIFISSRPCRRVPNLLDHFSRLGSRHRVLVLHDHTILDSPSLRRFTFRRRYLHVPSRLRRYSSASCSVRWRISSGRFMFW